MSHDGGAVVPAIFAYEIENILTIAERRKRIVAAEVDEAIDLIEALAFQPHPYALALGRHTEMARRHSLSIYDAAYVVTTAHLRAELLTADSRLAKAAREEKIATEFVA